MKLREASDETSIPYPPLLLGQPLRLLAPLLLGRSLLSLPVFVTETDGRTTLNWKTGILPQHYFRGDNFHPGRAEMSRQMHPAWSWSYYPVDGPLNIVTGGRGVLVLPHQLWFLTSVAPLLAECKLSSGTLCNGIKPPVALGCLFPGVNALNRKTVSRAFEVFL